MDESILKGQLAEDQRMIGDVVRDWAGTELRPRAAEIDESGEVPPAIRASLAEMGLLAISIAEDEGGAGLDATSEAVALGELAAASGGVALEVWKDGILAARSLAAAGRSDLVTAVATGQVQIAFAIEEARAGWQARDFATRLEKHASGHRLSGRKVHVLGGMRAERILVAAAADGGPALVLVDAGAPHCLRKPGGGRLGMRSVETAHFDFDGVEVADDRWLAAPGQADARLDDLLTRARIGLAAIGCGLVRAARTEALRYATERRQFRQPIAAFGAVRERLARIESHLVSGTVLVLAAAREIDAGRDASRLARVALSSVGRSAMEAADDALQIFGGYGYSREYPVERLYRDARYVACALGGWTDLQQEMAASSLADG